MKKYISFLVLLLSAFTAFGQFPITGPTFGSPNTSTLIKGVARVDSAIQIRSGFADTTEANYGRLDELPGIVISAGDSLWRRNNAATAWVNIMHGGSSSGDAWLLTGNTGTSAGTNFIGTTDYQGIQFKVNNTHAGGIGVGTNIFGDYEGGLVAIGYRAAQNMPLTTKAEVVAIGANTLQDYVGYGNGGHVAVGTGALRNMVNGERNTAVGEYAGFQGTTGDHHAWFGAFAGEVTSGGSFNSGLGGEALRGIKDGSYNTGVGGWGLYRNTTIVDYVTITNGGSGYTSAPTVTFSNPDGASPGTVSTLATGTATINAGAVTGVTITEHGSGYSNEDATVTVTFSGGGGSGATGTVVLRSATGNTGLGFAAGGGNYSSHYDVHVGYLSGWGTNGLYDSCNTFIGTSSGRSSTLSTTDILAQSTAIGYNAKASTSKTIILGATGSDQPNIGIGTLTPSKYLEVSGSDILVYTHTIGRGGGAVATNVAFGYQALTANTTGFAKVAIGYQALNADNTTAAGEVGIGYQAMGSMLDPSQSVAIGYRAMYGSGAKIQRQSIAIGTHAMENAAATGGLSSENNIAIGQNSLYNLTTGYNNTMVGWYSGYTFTTQTYNSGFGLGALYGATGNYLTAFGVSALQNASGDGSVAMGYAAGFSMAGATGIFIGYRAGYGVTTGTQGIYIGRESGNLVTTGNYNVIIGGNDGSTIATLNNRIIIADGQGNQRLYIDNTGLFNLNGYGSGTHTGTATKYLAVNSSGDIIEENVPGGAAPLLPTTGTGTATGSVTGDLGGNSLTIQNASDITFSGTSGNTTTFVNTGLNGAAIWAISNYTGGSGGTSKIFDGLVQTGHAATNVIGLHLYSASGTTSTNVYGVKIDWDASYGVAVSASNTVYGVYANLAPSTSTPNAVAAYFAATSGTTSNYAAKFARGKVSFGTSGTETGTIELNGSTSGTVTLKSAAAAGTWTMTLPTSAGANNYVLQTDGTGTTSWVAQSGGTPGGSNTQVQYNNSSSFGGISGATSDGTNMTFGSGNLRATSPRVTTGILDANGNELFLFTATASAVNEVTFANAATGANPTFTASGGDTDVGFGFITKAAGTFNLRGNSTQAATLRLYEDTDDGTNYTAFKVGTQSGDITYTLPTADGTSGYVLSTNGSGVLSWIANGSGGTPAGNFGNVQINRNSAFATPASDSLDFESATGLTVKGYINATSMFYTGGLTGTYSGYSGVKLGGSSTHAVLDFVDNGSRIGEFYTTSSAFLFFTDAGKSLEFYTNNSFTNPLIYGSGSSARVGINKFSPATTLDVGGDFQTSTNAYLASSSGGLGVGTITISAKANILSTTEQLRVLYDASNYYSTTVSSTGGVTFNAVGSGARFSYSDGITLAAGTATAGTSPLKLTSGTNLTTAEAGAFEYDGTWLYFTLSGTTRNTFVFATTNQTLTNKRVTPRTSSTVSSSSLTIDSDSYDFYAVTALAADMTINAPSGTPTEFQPLTIRIKDDGTSRTLTWNSIFREIGATLPASTTAGKTTYIYFRYNITDTKWDLSSVIEQP